MAADSIGLWWRLQAECDMFTCSAISRTCWQRKLQLCLYGKGFPHRNESFFRSHPFMKGPHAHKQEAAADVSQKAVREERNCRHARTFGISPEAPFRLISERLLLAMTRYGV